MKQFAGKNVKIELMNGAFHPSTHPSASGVQMAYDVTVKLIDVYPDSLLVERAGKRALIFARAVRSIQEG